MNAAALNFDQRRAARVSGHNGWARGLRLPATLTPDEWTRTLADFAGSYAYCQAAPFAELEPEALREALREASPTALTADLINLRSVSRQKGLRSPFKGP